MDIDDTDWFEFLERLFEEFVTEEPETTVEERDTFSKISST